MLFCQTLFFKSIFQFAECLIFEYKYKEYKTETLKNVLQFSSDWAKLFCRLRLTAIDSNYVLRGRLAPTRWLVSKNSLKPVGCCNCQMWKKFIPVILGGCYPIFNLVWLSINILKEKQNSCRSEAEKMAVWADKGKHSTEASFIFVFHFISVLHQCEYRIWAFPVCVVGKIRTDVSKYQGKILQ